MNSFEWTFYIKRPCKEMKVKLNWYFFFIYFSLD